MKKLKNKIGWISLLLLVVTAQPTSANSPYSIVIIDTAINTALPELRDRVIHEVCMVQTGRCSNGQMNAEGPGAANLQPSQTYSGGFEHGTIMALIASQIDPKAKIVFIRVAGTLNNGTMGTFSDVSVTRALDWTIANQSRFNIRSVSASVGNTAYNRTGNYCPIRATHNSLISNIETLKSLGVATMFAAGNNRDKSRVNFPACISQAIAVSAVNRYSSDDGWKISPLVNTGPDVDFYALGSFLTPLRDTGAMGQSSPATAALSAFWAKNFKGTWDKTYEYLQAVSLKSPERFVNVLN